MSSAFLYSVIIAGDKAYAALSCCLPTSDLRTIFERNSELKDGLTHQRRFVTLAAGISIAEDSAVIVGVEMFGPSKEQGEACARARSNSLKSWRSGFDSAASGSEADA